MGAFDLDILLANPVFWYHHVFARILFHATPLFTVCMHV